MNLLPLLPQAVDLKALNRRQKGEAAQDSSLVSFQLVKPTREHHLQADKNYQHPVEQILQTVKASKPFPRIAVVRTPVQNVLIPINPTTIVQLLATPISLGFKTEQKMQHHRLKVVSRMKMPRTAVRVV